MPLNNVKGNMYPFVTHTWNTIKGECPHGCLYCYMTRWGQQPEVHFDGKELKTDLGRDNFIFVGSSCDMFADSIDQWWIASTLRHCIDYAHKNNKFLFQSKNPSKMERWQFPASTVLGTTIESNRFYPTMGSPPSPTNSADVMQSLSSVYNTMLTIEPIMDFDLQELIELSKACNPAWINIGANTNNKVQVVEPERPKIKELIAGLKEFTEVKLKKNLSRLMR